MTTLNKMITDNDLKLLKDGSTEWLAHEDVLKILVSRFSSLSHALDTLITEKLTSSHKRYNR